MLKRITILFLILSAMLLVAMSPLNAASVSDNAPKLQTTVEVTVAVETAAPESTAAIPVTGNGNQIPFTTWIIFGLLAILGVAIVIGGMALITRRQV